MNGKKQSIKSQKKQNKTLLKDNYLGNNNKIVNLMTTLKSNRIYMYHQLIVLCHIIDKLLIKLKNKRFQAYNN
jgi:hypothetical protein